MTTPLRIVLPLILVGIAVVASFGKGMAQATNARPASPTEDELIPFVKGSATLVVVPDTEVYANKRPAIFKTMFEWIAGNIRRRNIASVLHVGDITNRNTDREWQVARKCYDLIEGRVPYVLATGNHDYDGTEGRLSLMNKYFHASEQKKWKNFGDVYEKGKLENHYQFVEIHGRKWIVLSLEMGPRKAVVEWGNEVLKKHRSNPAIILTHAYLYYGNTRYDHRQGGQRASPYNYYGDGADGEMLWNQLVRRHPNVMIVQCGHLSSGYLGYRVDEGDYGNVVHQTMVDYEKMKGGYGFLRLLEFLPDGKTVQVRTYSPYTKKKNPRDPKLEEFRFELQAATRKTPKRTSAADEGGATARERLAKPPIHRYSFGKSRKRGRITDSIGSAHGSLRTGGSRSGIDGKGRLVLAGAGHIALPPNMLKGEDASFEVWFAPTADKYNWGRPLFFGNDGGDGFYYCFRTFNVHRSEIMVNGHNEDIQKKGVPVKKGEMVHVVVTYDHDGADGSPLLCTYRDGERRGSMRTSLKLTDVEDTRNSIGPFEGLFDEMRVYDYPLTDAQVRGSFAAGPDKLEVAE